MTFIDAPKRRVNAMHRILIIDDEIIIRKLFTRLLTREKYKVLTAADGKKGIETVKKEKLDLVILDLKMPGIDGIEALKRIKEINKNIRVIIITAFGTIKSASDALNLGADDFISKPFDIAKIRMTIKNVLKMKKLASEVEELRSNLKSHKVK